MHRIYVLKRNVRYQYSKQVEINKIELMFRVYLEKLLKQLKKSIEYFLLVYLLFQA